MRRLPILLTSFCIAWTGVALAQAPPPARPAAPPLFSAPLPEIPGSHLEVVALTLPPRGAKPHPHRHPGSVYVYVTKGTARLGVEGQPVQVVHTGESFFEPKGALHVVAESDSDTEPASAIAVMIVPDGAPLVLLPGGHPPAR
jgi:quercetin dioxygenase-like cupin family protein